MIAKESARVLDPEREPELRSAVDSALAAPIRGAFVPMLEADYEDATRAERRRHIRMFLSIFAVATVCCLLLDRTAGELKLGIVVRLYVEVPLALLAVWFLRMPIGVRAEGLCLAIPCLAIVGGTAILGEAADAFYRSRILMSAGMFVYAVNFVIPTRFRDARLITIFSVLIFDAVVLSGAGFGTPGRDWDLVGFTTGMGLISLNVVYQGEAARRVGFLLRLRDRLSSLELSRANDRLVTLSQTDALTNVFNRRFFDSAAPQARAQSLQNQTRLALLMIDVDHFKRLNDTSGHAEGDVCLQRIARTIGAQVRASDVVARYGGEEFVVILPDTSAADAVVVAERIRAGVESLHFDHAQGPRVMTVSIGVASLAADERGDTDDLLKAADLALYSAKDAGRNRVVRAREPLAA